MPFACLCKLSCSNIEDESMIAYLKLANHAVTQGKLLWPGRPKHHVPCTSSHGPGVCSYNLKLFAFLFQTFVVWLKFLENKGLSSSINQGWQELLFCEALERPLTIDRS